MRRYFTWIALFHDIRSAVVGGVFGAFASILTVYASSLFDRVYEVYVSENNYAQPLPNLMRQMEEEKLIKVSFDPENLEYTATCEFWRGSNDSFSEIFFDFMNDYSACFSLRQRAIDSYVVNPNARSGQMEQIGADWVCDCS